MFMGEFAHNIDRKGRLIMPAKFREELGERVVVNRGLDGCLYVYTLDQWQVVYEKLSKLPTTKKDARKYQRLMLSKASECELDGQGRILIPSNLVELAELEKECMIIGVANHIEIWAKHKWELMEEEEEGSFEEIAESLSDFMEL
ncbi:division/cell wall cluster transcriptional repressor MraZ [uncultured Dubosiella sp.]|uniref:division/cell wall cluster transcriptional repressor MraZ n=1 Tax=uncultured Dubosiella sp. TaxID=1937011 RepID=UPI0025DFBDAC|nr:division/cell wall cluster transcriptional repressor MraZ [uncultured Dubosiella sp.]